MILVKSLSLVLLLIFAAVPTLGQYGGIRQVEFVDRGENRGFGGGYKGPGNSGDDDEDGPDSGDVDDDAALDREESAPQAQGFAAQSYGRGGGDSSHQRGWGRPRRCRYHRPYCPWGYKCKRIWPWGRICRPRW